jgi:broad specificity phosphatase PhoE
MLAYNHFYLYLIRHGQSEVNAIPDQMGQTPDSRLTDKGKNQALLLGERLFRKEKLEINHVFASPYTRALDTCNIALGQHYQLIEPVVHPDLREYSAGDWTGASRHEAHTVPVLLKMAAMGHGFQPPQGESLHEVERRASKWLEDHVLYNEAIQKEAAKRASVDADPMNIFVFSHGMTIKTLLHYVMGFDQSFTWKVTLENTSISKLYFGREGWRLLSINDHAHLL